MKKLMMSLLISMAILLCFSSVFAAEFKEIGMKIEIPENYYNLKEGIEKGDSQVEYYVTILQTTKENLKKEYEQSSILYNGINEDFSNELYIYETSNKTTQRIFNLSMATEKELNEVKEEIKNMLQEQGMYSSTQEMYTVGNISFIYSVIKNKNATIYQYYTVINGKGITISLNTTDSSDKTSEIKKVIDTVSFNDIEEKPTNIKTYILIGSTAALIIMVIVLMFMAFSNKNKDTEDF